MAAEPVKRISEQEAEAMTVERALFVFVHDGARFRLAGRLESTGEQRRPTHRGSVFVYDAAWLAASDGFALDPINLPLQSEPFVRNREPGIETHIQIPGVIRDAAPDSWGRHSLRLRYGEGDISEVYGDIDYVAASSVDRFGGLAFGLTPERPCRIHLLSWTELKGEEEPAPTLEALEAAASYQNERPLDPSDAYYQLHHHPTLRNLLVSTSSLGGARPKATFEDPNGGRWLAKFGATDDLFDVVRTEAACLDMAAAAGIDTPQHMVLSQIGPRYRSALLVRRVDRVWSGGQHVPLCSMSMETALGVADRYTSEHSYADLLGAVTRAGGAPAGADIYRRLLLNVCIGNSDDHLRNHAMLRQLDGTWRLSPVFDIAPVPGLPQHALRLHKGHANRLDDAIAAHESLELDGAQAAAIQAEVGVVVAHWRDYLKQNGVPPNQVARLSAAFAAAPELRTFVFVTRVGVDSNPAAGT